MPGAVKRSVIELRYARFVDEYLKDYNAVQAYLRAFPGTAYKTAKAQSGYLISKDKKCMELIERLSQNRIKLSEVTAQRVILELARLGFSDARKMVKAHDIPTDDGTSKVEMPLLISEMDEDTARAVKEIEFSRDGSAKLKLHSKEQALGLLAKITGALPEPSNLRQNVNKAGVVAHQSDYLLDEEISAALEEAETDNDSDAEGLIDMDDEGEPMLNDNEQDAEEDEP